MRARRMQEYADAAKPEVQILSPRRLIHSETLSRLSGISSRPATCACKVLNARHGSEVSILCPQGCFEGSRGCQYHAAGHRQLQFTCQRGGLHGQGIRERNDGCLAHRVPDKIFRVSDLSDPSDRSDPSTTLRLNYVRLGRRHRCPMKILGIRRSESTRECPNRSCWACKNPKKIVSGK